MPKDQNIKKVLVIGSGPIIIGQAAEFDYAGTQACRALREEGVEIVLCNSNPATIMTDEEMADRVYIEPLTPEMIKRIIEIERPDSLLPGLGGQVGLNMAMELHDCGFLDEMNVRLLGTPAASIKMAEDREAFRDMLLRIKEPVISNVIANNIDTALEFACKNGYPIVVRPAYTMGGTGGGFAHNEAELRAICEDGLRASRVHQVLIERSVAGFLEIEFEVMRDSASQAIVICDMENIDPVGIHTGDSIVVAPCQSLSDEHFTMLRESALKIIQALEVEGGCNVQYALNPKTGEYFVIEVNPRVSRSSALASKATGYSIARVSTKVALGYRLDEIENGLTGCSAAIEEPVIDYVVIKFPRMPFDKFTMADKELGTKMKATGEVMAIGSRFESAFLKAIRSLELGYDALDRPALHELDDETVVKGVKRHNDERIFYISEAFRRNIPQDDIFEYTQIAPWFLERIRTIVRMEQSLRGMTLADLGNYEKLKYFKTIGISDSALARFTGCAEADVRALRARLGLMPGFGKVDTCSGKYPAAHPYYYSSYEKPALERKNGKAVVVLGSGPIRIGQGIEFDYCSVHCVWTLLERGYEAVIINCNPETVSTDYDTSTRLYFEPLTPENVFNILEHEQPEYVVAQFGGQTAIKLTRHVETMGYKLLGTQPKYVDMAEDRREFDALLESLNILRPKGDTTMSAQEAVECADRLGYPVLVRPSFVLGGQGMEIAYSRGDVEEYMSIIAGQDANEHPVLVDKYIAGLEVEVDAICDSEDILIPGIMEHIERAGIHSGDSISVYPTRTVSASMQEKIVKITRTLSLNLNVEGLINIQYIVDGDNLYVIEVNPRSSRTVPYISKVTGVPMVELAVRCALGAKLSELGYGTGLYKHADVYAVKVPVFSLEKLPEVEVSLGPEMKSTGEVLGLHEEYAVALYKGLLASGISLGKRGNIILTVKDDDKAALLPIAQRIKALGYKIYATTGTARFLAENGLDAIPCYPIHSGGHPNVADVLMQEDTQLIISTPTRGRKPFSDGFRIRRMAVERRIPCLTSLDTAVQLMDVLERDPHDAAMSPRCLQDLSIKEKAQ